MFFTVDFKCPLGYMKCQNSYCVPPKLLCNGVQDCPLGEDEYDCGKDFSYFSKKKKLFMFNTTVKSV
jgi:hypothetical protein